MADDPISVSDLMKLVKGTIEAEFKRISVIGELSGYRGPHHSGHVYATLKDKTSAVKIIIWRSTFQRLRFKPEEGMELVITGKMELYVPRGEMSLIVQSLSPVGVGDLQLAFQQMHDRLEAEGLFSPEHKQPVPVLPRRVAVLTSPTGAAIRDVITTLQRRNPSVGVLVVPCRVQGEGSADDIARKLTYVDEHAKQLGVDTIIVGRGGGSLEDLWAFNEEVLARAIFAAHTPVISAVGHETDITIADLVADERAPTPTAAAEIAAPEREDWRTALDDLRQRLGRALRLDVGMRRERLNTMRERLASMGPLNAIRHEQQRLDYLWERLGHSAQEIIQHSKNRVTSNARQLDALSPLKVLGRGYSITTHPEHGVITNSDQVQSGDVVTTRTHDGEFKSTVNGP